MSQVTASIHDFARPPVHEVVVGVQFAPLALNLLDIGLFSATVADRFPRRRVVAPLMGGMESFDPGAPANQPEVHFRVFEGEATDMDRAWLISEDESNLIQVQSDRLLFNWRAREHPSPYPRYSRVRSDFAYAFTRFAEFLTLHKLGGIAPVQCEVSYFNRIYVEDVDFTTPQKIFKSFPQGAGADPAMPGEFESISFVSRRRILGADGAAYARLYIKVAPASDRSGRKFHQIELTVRGVPSGLDLGSIQSFHDMGRQTIVDAFVQMTTEAMHQAWGRTQ